MNEIVTKIKDIIKRRLIKPVLESVSPVKEAALGTAIGMFVGLTPTVGIQMWIIFMIWFFAAICLMFIPISIASYFLIRKTLLVHRIKKAKKMGMNYETWRGKFERRYKN